MSDPLSNLEIQDVLSSIRRLVSEDRKTKEVRQVAAEPEKPVVEKLILTDALRIEAAADVKSEDAPQHEEPAIAADDRGAAPEIGASADAPDVPAPIRPASVLEDDIASLETTIAELEAAVAGISQDFEPDGSEVGKSRDDLEKQALEDAFDDGFAVDFGGPSRFEAEDASLAAPVTGDAMSVVRSGKMPEAAIGVETAEDDPQKDEAEAAPDADEIAFLRHQSGPRRPDLQLISGGDRLLATAGAVLSGRLHLGAANSVGDPDDATDGGAGDEDVDAMTEAGEASVPEEASVDQGEQARAADSAESDAEPAEDTADATQPHALNAEMVERVPDAPVEELLVEAPEMPDAGRSDAPIVAELPEPISAAHPGGAADPLDEADEDDVGLFAEDTADIDMDMLRDLVAEVIREELQGPLGERITRNVRKLVRQEIARALEAHKFD
jgi:hypothetical protein